MKKIISSCIFAFSVAMTAPVHANQVNLYATNSEDAIQVVLDSVREQAPDLRVNVIRAGTGALLQRVRAEKDNPGGDVFWSSGFGSIAEYTDVAASYASPEAAAQPADMVGPDNKWLGTNVHVVVLMVNKNQLKGDVPTGWDDILNGDGENRIAFADPSASSSSYLQLYGIYKKYGEQGVRDFAKNVTVTGNSSSVYRGVAQGEYPIGITIEYAAYRYIAGGMDSIELVYPEEGTFLSPEGLFVVENAPNQENAQRLFDIMSSKQTQENIFEHSYRRPARTDINVSELAELPNYDDIAIFPIDQEAAGAEKDELIQLWNDIVAGK